ncbi:SLC13 family permease [Halomonas sp. MCCC 1A17488]|uniref:SLC13 family permease n=1 Tax=Billgrantia sulfidoxydans TaxID=2733484 RepID=A0ABX7W1X1_9GAMM|nr:MULTISPECIES: SLC13 family permease [Halomonas]MCE8016178.1 SLC13 family permease [Halomonas sp. MCCC 1A17488]MCG3239511.1 SLC13 family permease [Halomonas sp. MCCC 1A17488]QPP50568.1 SLC13 family permease [Halomonas sp. SS10-MC5]QTP54155.1 SLC13 family permease [Halomonas sulfidoxydans]
MPLDAWISLAVVLVVFPLMAFSRLGPDIVLLGAVILLLTLGVIDPAQALGGFSSTGLFTVAFMYVLVASIRETGGIDLIIRHVLGRPRSEGRAMARLLLPVASLSGFLNNTPVVATFIPAVLSWSRRLQLSAHRLLMPLSFASILGGTITLFGTSTNLVVHGLLVERRPDLDMGLFDIAWVGVPVAVAGLLYLLLMAPRLLPARRDVASPFANPREYTIEMEVDPAGPLVNRSVEEAGLRHLQELFLVEIERDGNVVSVVGPGERLKGGDRLVFAGTSEGAVELQQMRGLVPSRHGESSLEKEFKERRLVEAVVSDQCQFVGQRIRDGHFRTLYGAAVLAVCRGGERVAGNLGQVRLQPADVLLLEVRPPFIERHRQSRDFLLISQVNGQARPNHEKAWLAWSILAAVVALATLGVMSMMNAAMLGAAAALITGCCSVGAAKRGLDTQVLLTIAASFGLGAALEHSGAAQALASGVLGLAGSSPWALLVAVYVLVSLLTSVITNNAAAVITFPVVMAGAEALGVNPMPYVVAVMFAASASFLTPIGYQTNLMVLGPGGYRFGDFLRVGGLLNLTTAAVALVLIPLVWPF